MTITKRQFSQLQAMGIDLWQLKNIDNDDSTSKNSYLDVDLEQLIKMPLFMDIISCLGLSTADVSYRDNALSLGLVTWRFSENEEISIDKHNRLVTPALSTLKHSPQLKRTLWQKLQELSI
jgi:DNA polymerase III psi subunit